MIAVIFPRSLLLSVCVLVGCQNTPAPFWVDGDYEVAVMPDGFRPYRYIEHDEQLDYKREDAAARRALHVIVDVNFDQVPLSDAINHLRKQANVNFFVNWVAFEAVGVESDLPVTLSLNQVRMRRALDLVLEQVGSVNELEPIGFAIERGIVRLSTERDLCRIGNHTRVYDVRDILTPFTFVVRSPEAGEKPLVIQANWFDGYEAKSGGSNKQDGKRLRERYIEELTSLIIDTVGKSDEWASYGGEVSSLREFDGDLFVRTTPSRHRDVYNFLAAIRATRERAAMRLGRRINTDPSFSHEKLLLLIRKHDYKSASKSDN